jgi:hypothetical protein
LVQPQFGHLPQQEWQHSEPSAYWVQVVWQTPPTADEGEVAKAPIRAIAAADRSSIFFRIPSSFQTDEKPPSL